MKTEALMCKSVAVCSPSDSLATAAGLMWDRDTGFLPVVDSELRVVGTITDRDIAMGALVNGARLRDIPVSQVMAKQLASVRADQEIDELEAMMKRAQVRRMPVVDGSGRLVGVISLNDLALASVNSRYRDGVDLEGVVDTLAAICTHRQPQPGKEGPEARA